MNKQSYTFLNFYIEPRLFACAKWQPIRESSLITPTGVGSCGVVLENEGLLLFYPMNGEN